MYYCEPDDVHTRLESELTNQISEAKYWLYAVIDELYKCSSFDEEKFERALDELSGVLGVKLPKEHMKIMGL